MKRRRRRGFTLIDLLIVVTILGVLARVTLPQILHVRLKARATRIVSDMEIIRGAARAVAGDSGYWPAAAAVGTRPTSMESYLPQGFSFTPEVGVAYEWRLTGMPNGDVTQATDGATMGMGARVDDDELRVILQRSLEGQETLTTGGVVYWLLWGPTARP